MSDTFEEDQTMTADAATELAATTPDAPKGASVAKENSLYEIFIGILTIISLVELALLVVIGFRGNFVGGGQVYDILYGTSNMLCLIFLYDFTRSLRRAPHKGAYLFGERPGRTIPTGVFDLLGSIPGEAGLRIFRAFRLTRVQKILAGGGVKAILREFVARRAESAIYIIVVSAYLVLLIGSCLIVLVEPPAPGSNIQTGEDAFWWAYVTITTVGYGDFFPVTTPGRIIGMVTMGVGIGIFGVLTSYLSSVFMSAPKEPETDTGPDPVATELTALRSEIADLRKLIEDGRPTPA
jgi:voltage-gated potassium channel Kch